MSGFRLGKFIGSLRWAWQIEGLTGVVRGPEWRYVTKRSGSQPRRRGAKGGGDRRFRKRCQDEEGTSRFIDLNVTGTGVQAGLFGVGGLIQVAVGLSGGVGALLTKRSGLSRNAWSRVI